MGVQMVSRSTSCLPATKPVDGRAGVGDDGRLAALQPEAGAAVPGDLHGSPAVYGRQHESRCPPNDTGSRRREGGGRNPTGSPTRTVNATGRCESQTRAGLKKPEPSSLRLDRCHNAPAMTMLPRRLAALATASWCRHGGDPCAAGGRRAGRRSARSRATPAAVDASALPTPSDPNGPAGRLRADRAAGVDAARAAARRHRSPGCHHARRAGRRSCGASSTRRGRRGSWPPTT